MNAVRRIDFGDFTKLPTTTHLLVNSSGGVIRVMTPHKGEVILDLRYDGMFSVYDHLASELIEDLRTLEIEARDYLFSNWLEKQTT